MHSSLKRVRSITVQREGKTINAFEYLEQAKRQQTRKESRRVVLRDRYLTVQDIMGELKSRESGKLDSLRGRTRLHWCRREMTPLLCVAGARGVGKTSVAVALVSLLLQHLGRVIAWKPLDVNGIGYQIQDSGSDGERLHRATNMSEHINLLNPYLFNSRLASLLAAQRDGVKVDEKVLVSVWSCCEDALIWC